MGSVGCLGPGPEQAPGQEGVTICLECLNMLSFTPEGKLEKMSVETYSRIVNDQEVMFRIDAARVLARLYKEWVRAGRPGHDPTKKNL